MELVAVNKRRYSTKALRCGNTRYLEIPQVSNDNDKSFMDHAASDLPYMEVSKYLET